MVWLSAWVSPCALRSCQFSSQWGHIHTLGCRLHSGRGMQEAADRVSPSFHFSLPLPLKKSILKKNLKNTNTILNRKLYWIWHHVLSAYSKAHGSYPTCPHKKPCGSRNCGFFFCFIPDTKHLRIERALSLQIVLYSDRSGDKQVEEWDAAGTVRSQSVQETILGGYRHTAFFYFISHEIIFTLEKIELL